jgi:hypothetical protein
MSGRTNLGDRPPPDANRIDPIDPSSVSFADTFSRKGRRTGSVVKKADSLRPAARLILGG